MKLDELYQEIILDHGKNPRNLGRCSDFNSDAEGFNPLCGDKVHIYLKLNNEKKILDTSFEGEGCAISVASASIITDIIKGKDYNVSKKIINDFLEMIKNEGKITSNSLTDNEITTLMSLSGVKKFPMRVKCATMAWHTFTSALENKKV
tara:strand:- start:743 stop:1189 length:447 start_codon:yes stop_codon:yes gene_type:complete